MIKTEQEKPNNLPFGNSQRPEDQAYLGRIRADEQEYNRAFLRNLILKSVRGSVRIIVEKELAKPITK